MCLTIYLSFLRTVLAGKLRDISAVDINELREAIDRIEERILPVLDSLSKENTLSGEILALGHSHIDAAWCLNFIFPLSHNNF